MTKTTTKKTTGIAKRKFSLRVGDNQTALFQKGDEVTLPENQFNDFAAAGMVEAKLEKAPAKS